MRNIVDDALKLSIFVGSPKTDLEEIRQEIIQSILKAGHIPDGMELWASATIPTLESIKEKLSLCDAHVIVLGANYGHIIEDNGKKISFTEWEYNQSKDCGRPILSFLLERQAVLDVWKTNLPPPEVQSSFFRLWEELREKSVCKMYKSLKMDKIGEDILNSLNQLKDAGKLRHLAGWVRSESKAAGLNARLQDNPFLMRIMERVVGFSTTGDRFKKEQNAKKAAADMFWDTMMNLLARENYMDIFLESGSSLAYVSEALESKMFRQEGWRISTNNALALLQLLLFTDGEVRRSPSVSPDPQDIYGAIFTKNCLKAYQEPPTKPRELYKKELGAIEEMLGFLRAGKEKQIILATASGWDTDHAIKEFHGPHVGSHANMLFKRALFMTGNPVVLFFSRQKVDPDFPTAHFKCRKDASSYEVGTHFCYPVFGAELPLEEALVKIPMALCIGYELDEKIKNKDKANEGLGQIRDKIKQTLAPELEKAGFDLEYAVKDFKEIRAGAIMMANKKFEELFME